MFDYIQKEKELITTLNINLKDLRIFLMGSLPNKESELCDSKSSECLRDDVVENLNGIDYALKQLEEINEALKGGKR